MRSVCRSTLVATLVLLAWSSIASAQSAPQATSPAQSATFTGPSDEMRPTTTTFLGDTGIWYVPTAEVLSHGTWSVGGGRRGTNYVQGLTNVADLAGSGALGIGNRVEVFGAFLFDTRIDRADPPVFTEGDVRQGGIVARYPGVNESWTGNQRGDLYLGSKVNMLSEYRGAPVALAVRGLVKLPTGNAEAGTSTGKTDIMADIIASKEIRRFFEVATYAGMEKRGNPDGFNAPEASYRWGTGVAFPSRSPLRVSLEANGDLPTSYRAILTDNAVVGDDGSVRPLRSDIRNRTRGTGGLTFQVPAGFFIGTGLSWNAPRYWDWQFRVGYHGRGRSQARSFAAAAPAAPFVPAPISEPAPVTPTPPAPAPVARAEAPAPAAMPSRAVAPAPQAFEFEDVFFNLDGFSLRPEAVVILDAALKNLQSNPNTSINIEGHTCDLGTAEYNIGLAERRADTVRDFFVSRGVSASRLRTASFGEENPEHANIHEEARRLNRRVALVVRLEP